MKPLHDHYDIIVIGSGPAGQNAAIAAANSNARVVIIEREVEVGGSCVQYGTIPSKTLRETSVTLDAFKRRSGDVFEISRTDDLQINSLMTRLDQVVYAHQQTTRRHLDILGIERLHGQASFVSSHELKVQNNFGDTVTLRGNFIVIATGSRPRTPDNIEVDHENIFDSDSILSMTYLPRSLAVFGGGVIASEYASTFAALGVRVVMIDRFLQPLGFLDPELVAGFTSTFQRNGGELRGSTNVLSVEWDGVSSVRTLLDDGELLETDKALVAMGRVANIDALKLEAASLAATDRGLLKVNEHFQTSVPYIYAVGDTIGPPALASTSMEQGRRAVNHAFGFPKSAALDVIPMGIYTIPEISSIGLNKAQAIEEHGSALVGRVDLTDLARGQIMAVSDGLLKLVADPQGSEIVGVQIVGEGATELIHLGQMAMLAGASVDVLANSIFNFPTLAEAYRLAALDIVCQRDSLTDQDNPSRTRQQLEAVSDAET